MQSLKLKGGPSIDVESRLVAFFLFEGAMYSNSHELGYQIFSASIFLGVM